MLSAFALYHCSKHKPPERRASCIPIFGFKMEAGLDVCYLYERYLLTQQIDCLCLFSVTSAGSTRTKKFLAPVVCRCGSNTIGPAGVTSAVWIIRRAARHKSGRLEWLVAAHSWISLSHVEFAVPVARRLLFWISKSSLG